MGQLALLDGRPRAPAEPVDDLLIGEDGLVDRVPIDLGVLAVDEAGREKIDEQALLLLVIIGIAGGELALPIERQTHRLKLARIVAMFA